MLECWKEKEEKRKKGRRRFKTGAQIEMVNGFAGLEHNPSELGTLCHSFLSSKCPHTDSSNHTTQAQPTTCEP